MEQQPASPVPKETPVPASPVANSSNRRLAIECVVAGLLLVGVFWKDVAVLVGGNTGAAPATTAGAPAEPVRWEYLTWISDEAKVPATLNKFGAHGWELVVANRKHSMFDRDVKISEVELIFKRPLNAAKQTTKEPSIVGVWQLTKGDKAVIGELTLECTAHQTVKVSGKAGNAFVMHGTYEIAGDSLLIILRHEGHTESTQDKIKKLTATELILEDEQGRIEEYKRK
jgi:uncharacterized protein (TIGR03066 family)